MSADTALQWRRWASDKPTASHWHDMRRAAIIRAHPEVLKLMGKRFTFDGCHPQVGLNPAELSRDLCQTQLPLSRIEPTSKPESELSRAQLGQENGLSSS